MSKHHYPDGREVKDGDLVKYSGEEDPDLMYYTITSNSKGCFSFHAPLGCLGDIDSFDDYELVKRYEERIIEHLIDDLKHLVLAHEQNEMFGEQLFIAIDALNRAKREVN